MKSLDLLARVVGTPWETYFGPVEAAPVRQCFKSCARQNSKCQFLHHRATEAEYRAPIPVSLRYISEHDAGTASVLGLPFAVDCYHSYLSANSYRASRPSRQVIDPLATGQA